MAHWMETRLGKYAGMDLIDRGQLMRDIGILSEKDKEDLCEEEIDLISFIEGADRIDLVKIIEAYEENGDFEV